MCEVFCLCQVSLVTVGHALIFLDPTSVSVISGLQAKTVRLILMNVTVATAVTSLRVCASTSMPPASLVGTAKDLNVPVRVASQVIKNRKRDALI